MVGLSLAVFTHFPNMPIFHYFTIPFSRSLYYCFVKPLNFVKGFHESFSVLIRTPYLQTLQIVLTHPLHKFMLMPNEGRSSDWVSSGLPCCAWNPPLETYRFRHSGLD